MSSVIPSRRPARSTRTATHKDAENATARQLRNLRAKPASSSTLAPASSVPLRVAGGPVVSRSKIIEDDPVAMKASTTAALPNKRKREALGELSSRTTQNKPLAQRGVAKPAHKTSSSTSESAAPRQPLHSRPAQRTASKDTEHQQAKDESEIVPAVADEKAMTVDRQPAISNLRRSLTNIDTGSPPHPFLDNVETDEDRAFKRRRTSEEPQEEFLHAFDDPEQDLLDEEAEFEALVNAEMEALANEEEAHPSTSAWSDLDIEDGDDPSMVSEYVLEIYEYLKELEQATLPSPKYMDKQKELSWPIRGVAVDWLIEIHFKFRLLPETLFLCINLFDRLLSLRVISLAKIQLVAVTCLFIAAKTEEVVTPTLECFLRSTDASYKESEMRAAERYILKILNWNLSYPSPIHFLRRISKADDYNIPVRTTAKYLLEIALVEYRLIVVPPSLLAAAAMWLSRLILGFENWTPNLAHYSTYSESQMIPVANLMLNYLLKPVAHQSFFKKYGGKRYNKASTRLYQWTRERWEEGTKVDLRSILPRLKAHIRVERAAETDRYRAHLGNKENPPP